MIFSFAVQVFLLFVANYEKKTDLQPIRQGLGYSFAASIAGILIDLKVDEIFYAHILCCTWRRNE